MELFIHIIVFGVSVVLAGFTGGHLIPDIVRTCRTHRGGYLAGASIALLAAVSAGTLLAFSILEFINLVSTW